MPRTADRILSAVFAERDRILSRRGLLTGGLKLGVGGAAAFALAGSPKFGVMSAFAQDDEPDFADDLEVLNYALTLEHLEYSFYRDGIGGFTFGNDAYGNSIGEYLMMIRDHEGAHVDTLTTVITDLGGEPVEEAKYDFGYTDMASFLATAAALENTGVSAYDGAGQFIENPDLLQAAGTIVAVEARHAAYLNLLTGESPFPNGFEQAKSKDDILAIAGPFIVS